MPGYAHLFFGIMIGVALIRFSERKFTIFHAFVWTFNNFMGPDIGWLVPDLAIANFINSCFGWMIFSAIYTLPFYVIAQKKKQSISYYQTYQLVIAGGFGHVGIDGLGHILASNLPWVLDNFWLYSFDARSLLWYNPAGLSLLFGVLLGTPLLIIIGIYWHNSDGSEKLSPSKKRWGRAIQKGLQLVGPILLPFIAINLLWFMPFGDGMWFTLGEAIYNTGFWGGVGTDVSYFVGFGLGGVLGLGFLICYKKKPEWSQQIFIAMVLAIFLLVWIFPGVGMGEAELGIIYFLLVFGAVPLYLLSNSYRHNK